MSVLGTFTLIGCSSIPDFLPTGSITIFIQSAAPTSWTRITSDTANNRMFRVITSGSGGGTGGSASPILNNVVPSHTHGFTTGNVSSDHSHGVGDPGHEHIFRFSYDQATGGGIPQIFPGGNRYPIQDVGGWVLGAGTGIFLGGISANHTHSGTTDNGSSQTNWVPRYIDTLLCSKD
jgi:hypothetical protein